MFLDSNSWLKLQKVIAELQLNLSMQERKSMDLETQINGQLESITKMKDMHQMELNDLKYALEQELKKVFLYFEFPFSKF
jgi:hypothetical protein